MKIEAGIAICTGEPRPITDQELRLSAVQRIFKHIQSLNAHGDMDWRCQGLKVANGTHSKTGKPFVSVTLDGLTQRQVNGRLELGKALGVNLQFPIDITVQIPDAPAGIDALTPCYFSITDESGGSSIACVANSIGHRAFRAGQEIGIAKPVQVLRTIEHLLERKGKQIGTPR